MKLRASSLRCGIVGALAVAILATAPTAHAWQRPGHAAGAAMTYEELMARNPAVVRAIIDILAAHPDRERFEEAANAYQGGDRDRFLFMQASRWPDDIREGPHDHPSWHYWANPIVHPHKPPPQTPEGTHGQAREAYALHVEVANDVRAPQHERAIAISWIFHILQDMHQPLHAAEMYSATYPEGDRLGSLGHVRVAEDQAPVTFHRYWDERILTATATVDEMVATGHALRREYPRESLPELNLQVAKADRIEAWAREETYPLARTLAYKNGELSVGLSPETAPVMADAYLDETREAGRRRLAVSSYRLADVLVELFGAT